MSVTGQKMIEEEPEDPKARAEAERLKIEYMIDDWIWRESVRRRKIRAMQEIKSVINPKVVEEMLKGVNNITRNQ